MMQTKFEDLSFAEQCAIVAVEILLQVVEGRRGKAEVERVVNDLLKSVPWSVTLAEVEATANRVATYGIQELPGYVKPEGQDGEVEV
jgi:hypothetical protein